MASFILVFNHNSLHFAPALLKPLWLRHLWASLIVPLCEPFMINHINDLRPLAAIGPSLWLFSLLSLFLFYDFLSWSLCLWCAVFTLIPRFGQSLPKPQNRMFILSCDSTWCRGVLSSHSTLSSNFGRISRSQTTLCFLCLKLDTAQLPANARNQ